MSSVENKEQRLTQAWWFFPALIAVIYFAVHMATATRYGYFRDALYYLACSEHLDWGYVDQPPLIAVLAWIARHTLGTSLRALLVWPALAGCGRILLTAAFARELGRGDSAWRWQQCSPRRPLSGTCSITSLR